jgi:maltose-binding protein MalE
MKVQYAFAKQIPHMQYLPKTTTIFELNQEIDLAVEKVIRGRATPLEALKAADVNVQKYMDLDKSERMGTDAP